MCNNRDILELIMEEYGADKAALFCEMVAMMYDIKYNAAKELDPLSEYDFERTWWIEASLKLHEQQTIE
jgi:hypothetical protein